MHSCGPHSADSNEHCYNRMASLKRRCSNLHSRILELQRIVNSGRRSIVQRNEGHCSHSNETSNDITRVHSSHLGPDACVRRARDVLFWLSIASQIKKRVQNCASLQLLPSQTTEGTVNDAYDSKYSMVKGWSGFLHLWNWDLPSDCWLLQ